MSIITAPSADTCYVSCGHWMGEGLLAKPSAELFIENLEALLRETRKSAAALARHLRVDRSLITAWVKGRSDPGVERLKDIADFFNVPVSRLFLDPTDSRSTGLELEKALRIVNEAVRKQLDAAEQQERGNGN